MSRKHSADEALGRIPLFSRLGAKELDAVHTLMTQTEIATGTVIAKQGAHGVELFVILSGTASVDRDGHHVADLGPGDFLGEMSMLDPGPRTATVTATSDMTALVATSQEFNALLDRSPSIARQMLPALAHRVRALADGEHTH